MANRLITPRRSLILPTRLRKPAKPAIDQSHPINRGLIGCWMLGDGPGFFAQDLTGFSVGTPTSVTLASSHHGGEAYAYNGSVSKHVLVSNPAWNFKINEPITIAAWTNLIFGGGGTIIDNVVSTNRNFSLATGNTDFNFLYGSNGFNEWRSATTPTNIYSGWHHLGSTFTYGANNPQLYYDGQPISGSWVLGGGSGTPDSASGGLIGGSDALNNAFHGSLEGIRIWKRYLSAAEFALLFAEPYVGIYDARQYINVGIAAVVVTAKGSTLPMMGIG